MIGISYILKKINVLSIEGARKFIHIGVSNWWFILMFFFDSLIFAVIPPIIFIILNYISYKNNLIKPMERDGKGTLGTVYFPIALLILVIASFTVTNLYIGGLGILVLGYGDGLAAVLGIKYGKKKIYGNKTLVGTIAMFVTTLMITGLLMIYLTSIANALWISLVIAFVISGVELVTPKSLDNLTVPLATSFLAMLLMLL
jgi:phytol kinase